jgi:hypothetical protein
VSTKAGEFQGEPQCGQIIAFTDNFPLQSGHFVSGIYVVAEIISLSPSNLSQVLVKKGTLLHQLRPNLKSLKNKALDWLKRVVQN